MELASREAIIKKVNDFVSDIKDLDSEAVGSISDGYHTFDELYHHRTKLFQVICNQNKIHAWKSWRHDDGTMFDGMFIAGIDTPEGSYTYHCEKEYWDGFNVAILEFAPKWDGHLPEDITRLESLGAIKC